MQIANGILYRWFSVFERGEFNKPAESVPFNF